MRNDEISFVDHPVTIKQNVEVDRAGAGTIVPVATQRPFDLSQHAQEALGRDISFELNDTV